MAQDQRVPAPPQVPNPYLSQPGLQSQDTSGTDALNAVMTAMDVDHFHSQHPVPALRQGQDAPPVTPAPAPADTGSVLDTAATVGKDVAGLGAGAVRAIPQAVGGLLDFGNDVGRFIGKSAIPVVQRYPEVARSIVNATNAWNNSTLGQAYNHTFGSLDGHTRFADQLSLRDTLGQVGAPTWNQGSAEALSLAVGYGAAARIAKGTSLAVKAAEGVALLPKGAQVAAKLAGHAAGLGATAGVLLDPEQERLSNVLQNWGVHSQFTDWLAAHGTPQEGAMEDRFKTGLENAAIGVPLDMAFSTAKYWIKALSDTRAANTLRAQVKDALEKHAAAASGDPNFNIEQTPTSILHDFQYRKAYQAHQFPADTAGVDHPVPGPEEDVQPEDVAAQHLNDAFAGVRSQELLNGLRQDIANANAPSTDVPLEPNAGGSVEPSNAKFPLSRAIRGTTFADERAPLAPGDTGAAAPAETSAPSLDTTATRGEPTGGVSKGRFGSAIRKPSPEVPQSAMAASARRSRLGIATDANAALKRAEAPEVLKPDEMDLTSDGRIVVSPDAKAAVDAAGLGRPFISSSEPRPPEDMVIHAGAKPYVNPKVQPEATTGEGSAPNVPGSSDGGTGEAGPTVPAQEGAVDKGLNTLGSMLRDTGGSLRLRVFGATPRADVDAFAKDARSWQQSVKANGDRSSDISWDQTPRMASKVGEWRIGNLASADDMPGLLRSFAERVGQTARPKSDVELMSQAALAANEIGEDPTAILEASRQIAGKIGSVDNAMATLRTLWTRGGQDLDEALGQGKDFTNPSVTTDADVNDLLQKIYTMDSMSKFVQDAKAGLGRGLRVNSLPDADTYLQSFHASDPEGTLAPRAPRAFGPLPRTRAELGDWADLWNMTRNNPLARAKFLEGQLTAPGPWKYLRTSLANFFTAAILSAPRTFAIELASPAIMSVVRTLEKTSGAAVLSLNPLATTAERQAMRQVAMRTPVAYLQSMGDIGDVWGQVKNAIETNQSQLNPRPFGGDLNYSLGPLTPNLIRASGQTSTGINGIAYSLGNLINVFPRAFSRLHGGVREMGERMAYLGEARAQAMMEAGQRGLKGNDFANYVQQKLESATDAAGAATDHDMLRNAQRSSLTGPVGEDGTRVRGLSNAIAGLRSDVPEFRYLLPVFNIEANLLGETLRRLPIAYLPGTRNLFAETAAELAGERGTIRQAEAHGRTMLGASFLLAGTLLNRAGLMTGAGPQGGTDRKVWLATHQPYSLRIGGAWVRYDKLPVLGGLLSIPATVNDTSTYHPGSESFGDMVSSGVGALAQWFKDRSALRTAAGILNVGADPADTASSFAEKFGGGVVSGFVPAAFQTEVTQPLDPYMRLKNSWTDYVKSALPGMSQTLEPVRSVLGEPVLRPYHGIPAMASPFAMAPQTSFKDDPVIDELDRLYQTTGYAAGADPHTISYGNFEPKDVKLEDGKSLFDHIVGARQDTVIGGKTLREALDTLFNSPQYSRAVDADSGEPRTSLGDPSRGYLVKQLFNKYETKIKAEVGAQSPIALQWLTAAAAKQKDDAYLRNYSADDLVKNPAIYKAVGINQAAYSAKITRGGGGLLSALQQGTGQ